MADDDNLWLLSEDEKAALSAASAAIARLSEGRNIQDWLDIGKALTVVRNAAMRRSNSGTPRGRAYGDAYAKLLPLQLRKCTSKNERTYAVNFFEKWQEIEPWYNSNDDAAQRRLVYPANILIAYAKYKRRREHPDEPVARVQRKRTLDLSSREAMRQSWAALVDLYQIEPVLGFISLGVELYGSAPVAVAAE